jgi:WD40 repeat protein
LGRHQQYASASAFDSTGDRLLTGSGDGTAILWSVKLKQALQTFSGIGGGVRSVAFAADGVHVITGSGGGEVTRWEPGGGGAGTLLTRHVGEVDFLAATPAGFVISADASNSDNGEIHVTAVAGGPTVTLPVPAGVKSLNLSPDGTRLVTVREDGAFLIWLLDPGALLHELRAQTRLCLTPAERQTVFAEGATIAQARAMECVARTP